MPQISINTIFLLNNSFWLGDFNPTVVTSLVIRDNCRLSITTRSDVEIRSGKPLDRAQGAGM